MTIPKSAAVAAAVLLFGMAIYGVVDFYRYGHFRSLGLRPDVPWIVLEATDVIHYAAGPPEDEELLVRLTSNGKVQWDTSIGYLKYEREAATITPEQVASIQYILDVTDKSGLREEMGPYNNYIDTWAELRLQIESPNGERQFSIVNPWPGEREIKPLPKEVKSIICEASNLRTKVTKEPLEEMCESNFQSQ